MEAKDLMMNDLVLFNNRACKIVSINANRDCVELYDVDDEDIFVVGKYAKHISPIQLTAEILELNGFKYDDCEKCWKLIEKEGRYAIYSIYVNSNRISIYNWRNEEGERFTDACNKVNVHYKYVHEFQHALRLCGLNELADNFKV